MAKIQHTVKGCIPIDKSVIEAYVALVNTNKYATEREDDRQATEGQGAYSDTTLYPNTRRAKEADRQANELERQAAEGTPSDERGANTRWGAEKQRQYQENIRQQQEGDPETSTAGDGSRWGNYKQAESERDAISAEDHRVAVADHGTASDDHITAVADHGTAGDDHTAATAATARANYAAAAAEHMVDIHRGPKGDQGNTGSSVDYPYELVNNLTTDDATKGLSAAMGKLLAKGYTYMGVATPTSTPVETNRDIFYLASQAGTYTNFLDSSSNAIVVNDGEVCALVFGTAWNKQVTGIATAAEVSQLGQYVDNLEWVKVVTDNEDKILYGVKTDGKFYFGAGCPPQVVKYVKEYVGEKLGTFNASDYADIITFLGNLIGGDTLAALLDGKVDKVNGKSLIDSNVAENTRYVENQEWIDVKTDSEDRILEGTKDDGTRVFMGDVNVKGEITSPTISQINEDIAAINDRLNVKVVDQIDAVKSLGSPIALMDYNHLYPNGDRDAKYNYLCVLKKTPEMVYLYYGNTPRSGDIIEDNFLKLAYCDLSAGVITDPTNWHMEIPSGLSKTPSQKWQEWYAQQTIISVQFDTDAATTRLNIPENERYAGMFITYNNGVETIVERFGYRTPPEGASWDDPISSTDTRTWNDIFASDSYWPRIYNRFANDNYLYFEDLYGDPLYLSCYGGGTIIVPDAEYPFRSFQLAKMPLSKGSSVWHKNIYMWKSKDGVIFEKCTFVDAYRKNTGATEEQFEKDGTVEPILHGNIITLYIRWRPYPFDKRQIGEEDVDLDGNLITCGHHLFGDNNLYIPAVSRLDYYRDIFFPTYIDSGVQAEAIKCFIRENNKLFEVTLPDDFSENGTILSQYVANNAIVPVQDGETIKQYIIYEATTWAHDLGPHSPSFNYDTNCAYIKIREIKFGI